MRESPRDFARLLVSFGCFEGKCFGFLVVLHILGELAKVAGNEMDVK